MPPVTIHDLRQPLPDPTATALVAVALPPPLLARIERSAAASGIGRADLIRRVLERHADG